ncbi:GNAT family N-acetyltransferase [Serinibacter salmoneus]|uniref:GNAT family N-acetyltransferase n=1 Tax=Serinibacter salmoneus TaxID=556530 RepID=UPI000BF495B0|nr:GNAT family N-acetyltransferase [Serinibacter salmoneus]
MSPGESAGAPASQGAGGEHPLSRPGLTWRSLSLSDLPRLADLVAACEAHDNPPYRTTAAELEADLFVGRGRNPQEDTLGAVAADGALIGYGRVRLLSGHSVIRTAIGGGVHPQARGDGLGSDLLAWQVSRARAIIAQQSPGPARIETYVEDDMPEHADLLRAGGFSPLRFYSEMLRDLGEEIPSTPLAASLTLQPWSSELEEEVHRAHQEAFADHWAREDAPAEMWVDHREHFAPQWSFIVMDRSTDRTRVAGYLLSSRYEQDWEALGYRVGYTELVGVRRAWRGRRVATALLSAAMRAYQRDGMQFAGLGVDTENPSSAYGLYEHLGYRRTRGSCLYTIEIED